MNLAVSGRTCIVFLIRGTSAFLLAITRFCW
jgi:hypothetical protein